MFKWIYINNQTSKTHLNVTPFGGLRGVARAIEEGETGSQPFAASRKLCIFFEIRGKTEFADSPEEA